MLFKYIVPNDFDLQNKAIPWQYTAWKQSLQVILGALTWKSTSF